MNNNNYKGYSLFNDIEEAALRTWNRCATMFNINSDHSPEESKGYAEQLSDLERKQVSAMFAYINAKGYETVRKEINNGEVGV